MKSKPKVLSDGYVRQNANAAVYDFTRVSRALALVDAPGNAGIGDNFGHFSKLPDDPSGSAVKVAELTLKPADSDDNVVAAAMDASVVEQSKSNLYDFSMLQEALHDSEDKIAVRLKVKRDVHFMRRARMMELNCPRINEIVRIRIRHRNMHHAAKLMVKLVDGMVHCSLQTDKQER